MKPRVAKFTGITAPPNTIGRLKYIFLKNKISFEKTSHTNMFEKYLKFTADFRQVYAAALKDWMGADADAILRKRWNPAPVLKT